MLLQNINSEFEEKFLAPYAMKSAQSKGRKYKEKEHPYRSPYHRDRDRIIHSAAFRRLEYKTQVFVNHEGDYYRTRLTHTLEVSQIARTISLALRLNVDLTEAVALAHDLGHTAFGHSGEEALNELMSDSGGFNHNLHGLRVVDLLENRYPQFPGLNLTWEVREGIIKHSSEFDRPGLTEEFSSKTMPLLETQVVDIADEIAYDNHDIDDGITSGLLKESDLNGLEIWNSLSKKIDNEYPNLIWEKKKYLIIRSLIDMQVTDLIQETTKNLKQYNPKDSEEIQRLDRKIVCFSERMMNLRLPLRQMLKEKLYNHYRVVRMSNKAKRFIKDLFLVYTEKPQALPPEQQANIENYGVKRVVCDYIAAMTDRCALDEHKKLFDPYEKV